MAVVSVEGSADHTPEADNNKIVRNPIDGFDERIVDDGDRSKIAAIQP